MPALDEGPRMSRSAFRLSFYAVYTASDISELSSDRHVSSGTLFCVLR